MGRLRAQGKDFSVADGKLLAGDHVLNGNAALVDKVKSLVGGTCTVFMNDQRVTTNVMKPDGSRAVGTRLAPGGAHDAIFGRKASFRGEAEILGEPYMTAYDPILDSGGQVLGILYVGVKKVEFLGSARDTFWTIIYFTLAIAALAILVSYVVARSGIVRPLKASITTMNSLAQGDLSVETPEPRRRDEIGEIMMALVAFKATGLEVERMRADRSATDERAAEQRKVDMFRLADGFESAVGRIVETVSVGIDPAGGLGGHAEFDRRACAGTRHRGRGGLRGSLHQRAVGGLGDRGDGLIRQRDQPPGAAIGADGQ